MKNSVYSILEFAWPIALSIVITPYVVRGLGDSAFGVLSLVSVTLGFFGLLDFGIGGAAIREMAQHLEVGDTRRTSRVLGTLIGAYLVVGAIGAALIALMTPALVGHILAIPTALQPAARFAFYCSAIGFPVSLLGGALASVPKAAQRFDLSTRVAIVFATAGPLVTVFLVLRGYGLPGLALASLALGVAGVLVFYRMSLSLLKGERIVPALDMGILKDLAGFGAWFLVASIGVTVLYQLDKLLVGSMLSVAAVTYYVVPGNLANRIQGFLAAATQVVFPASSGLFQAGHTESVVRLYRDGTRLTFLLACTLGVPMALFAFPFLNYWMGPVYAQRSTLVMVLLVATYVLLGLTGLAWGMCFGSGRAKVAAVFAVGMGAADVVLFMWLVPIYQINGAAVAYLVSALVGVPTLLIYVERRIVGTDGAEFLRQYARVLPAVAVQAIIAILLANLAHGLLVTLALMAVTAVSLPVLYFALRLATDEDRRLLGQLVQRVRPRR